MQNKQQPAKRILFSSHTAVRKGSAMSLHTLLSSLDRASYEPYVLFGDSGSLLSEMEAMGIPAYVRQRKPAVADITLLWAAWRLIKRHRIDLVHVNCALTYSRIVAQAAKLAGVPVVWHVRENPLSNRVMKQHKAIEKLANLVCVVSKEQQTALSELSVPVQYVPNGVVTERFRRPANTAQFRQRLNLPADAFTFCAVGTIEPRKGTEALVEAFADLHRQHQACRLIIVGAGPDKHEKSLLQRITTLDKSTASAIQCTGRIANTEAIMWAADILVMPSTWEGFPRSLIEAMAAGLPVIGTDVGDTRFIVEHGVTGWVIPKKRPKALQAALHNAMAQRNQLFAMGDKAAKHVQENYSATLHSQQMQTIFDNVLIAIADPQASRSSKWAQQH